MPPHLPPFPVCVCACRHGRDHCILFGQHYLRAALLIHLTLLAEERQALPQRLLGPKDHCAACFRSWAADVKWAQYLPCRHR